MSARGQEFAPHFFSCAPKSVLYILAPNALFVAWKQTVRWMAAPNHRGALEKDVTILAPECFLSTHEFSEVDRIKC